MSHALCNIWISSLLLLVYAAANLFDPPIRTGTRTPIPLEGFPPSPLLAINHESLRPLLGRPTGKSKFMCVQFCLSVAELARGSEKKNEAGEELNVGDRVCMDKETSLISMSDMAESIDAIDGASEEVKGDVDIEEEEDIGNEMEKVKENENGDVIEVSLPPSEAENIAFLLEGAKAAALKGLNDRSGKRLEGYGRRYTVYGA